jgi:phosphoenolpyruvate carboxylase
VAAPSLFYCGLKKSSVVAEEFSEVATISNQSSANFDIETGASAKSAGRRVRGILPSSNLKKKYQT